MHIGGKARGLLLGVLGLFVALAGNVGGAALSTGGPQGPAREGDPLVVHEWGTFLSVQGSDGVTLGGMVDSEEALPDFVRERSLGGRNRKGLFQKMETPVTYFYTDRPRVVRMRVDMPRGLLTHWSPAVLSFGPPLKPNPKGPPPESYLDWGNIELIPDRPSLAQEKTTALPQLRPVAPDNTWRFVRATDSALVRVQNYKVGGRPFPEVEKFLFYRGVGTFSLPLEIHASGMLRDGSERLTLINRGQESLPGIFLVKVEKDTIQFAELGDLSRGESREVVTRPGAAKKTRAFSPRLSLKDGVPQVKKALAAALVRRGLYEKEAWAMVNNWEKSYFRTDGLRVLYTVPRARVEEVIPLHISPAPARLVRVMVGRVEVLTPAREMQLERAVADLSAKDPKVRQAAQDTLSKLGRLREPVLRRILAVAHSPEIRKRAEALIKAKS